MPPRGPAPEAAVVLCPDCGEDQVHDVLQAPGLEGAQHATVRCRECSRVHRSVLRPAKLVEVPIIISRNEASERATVALPEDEILSFEDELVAAGQQVQVRTIDRKDGKRVRSAKAKNIATLWVIHFEEILVKVAVNMGRRTISKSVPVGPRDTFTVGDEFDLDRLRIFIHAIKTPEGTLHRGSAEAKDITRIFARTVHLSPDQRRERRAEFGIPAPKPRYRPMPQRGGPPPSRPASRPKPGSAPARPARPASPRTPSGSGPRRSGPAPRRSARGAGSRGAGSRRRSGKA